MIRIAWRSLVAHKLRSFLTALAILLGVAMISGTYVFTDQIDRAFDEVFTEAYSGTDVTITRKASFTSQFSQALAGLPESMVDDVRAVDGVGEAYGYIAGQGAIALDGEVVETGGSPTLFFSYVPSEISATSYVDGEPPAQTGDLGISQKFAEDEGLAPGSSVTVITDTGAYDTRVSGVFVFGSESSLGGSVLLNMTFEDGQTWFDMAGRVSEIDVQAAEGVTPDELAARIRAALSEEAEVKTGEQAAADQSAQISEAIGSFLNPVLLSFGGVAVLVGAFTIFNAFTMTVAQRRREFAMLRALGASRRQVLFSVTGEALGVGVVASIAGLFVGLGFAAGINELMKAADVEIPLSGLVMEPRTVVVGLAVGISVALLSALIPAVRATRVPPIAALQEGSSLPPSRYSRLMPYLAVVVAVVGIAGVVNGMYGAGSTTQRLLGIAAGAVLLFVAVAISSKYFVAPVARAVGGWPMALVIVSGLAMVAAAAAVWGLGAGLSVALVGLLWEGAVQVVGIVLGAAGVAFVLWILVQEAREAWGLTRRENLSAARLARGNSMRNPARTAATAAALMVGLGVVVFVAVFAQGLRSSFIDSFDQVVRGDYVITGANFLPLPAETVRRVESVPEVDAAAGIELQQVQVDGNETTRPPLYAADPYTLERVWDFDWIDGDDDVLLELEGGGAVLEQQTADSLGLRVGQGFEVLTAEGTTTDLEVLGIYRDPIMLNGLLVSTAVYDRLYPRRQPFMILASTGGASAATTQAIESALADVPTAQVLTADEYKDDVVGQLNQLLNLFYGLLAMSVIISLFGIVNTLVLSVYERTREIGMLRAIGASRRQIRRSVRYESVITSVIGGLLGIVVGVVFAYIVTTRFGGMGIKFAVPGLQLLVALGVAVVAGVLAAILPARRAARIDILEAIHYE
ncbi:MAG: ABC transporter permease [Thermoleophilia bacterium]|nr:ABC transporter permease [Thermoleophilia bacterium]